MNKKAIIIAFTLLLTASTVSAQISPELEDRLEQRPDTERVDVILLTQQNSNERAKQAVRNTNGNVNHDFSIIDGIAVTIPRVAAENLAEKDFVKEIEPDYTVETKISESTQRVNADKVWNNSTGEGVDVAVLDTGIEDDTILNIEDQVDYTGEGTDDLNGHGTHVAGIIASPNEEYKGIAYGADLFDVKVLNQEGTGSASDVIAGLDWAVDNNAEVATLSLGASVEQCDGTSSLSEAVDNTVENGVTVTVAAGNNGPESETITAPGCSEKGLTVGSSGNGDVSEFSGRGSTADGRIKPDLVAPGEGITSLTNNDGDGPQFASLSGTSMATPHVAGAAAILQAEEDLTPKEIKNITTSTARDLGLNENDQGKGRLDVYTAYQEVAQTEKKKENSNQPPKVKALETQVELLNTSAEAVIGINTTDEENKTLNATFYLEGEEKNLQEGYGEIKYTETNLPINSTYSWSAEVSDGINTTTTGTKSFNTNVEREENETEQDNQTGNKTKPPLPDQASNTARKARAGFFNPNSPFYGLDVALDRASVSIGLRTKESVMEERADEARKMAEIGNEKGAEKAVRQLRSTAGDSENSTREAEKAIDKVIRDTPEEAKKGLQNALRNVEKEREERGKNQQRLKNPKESSNESNQEEAENGKSQRPSRPSNKNSSEPENSRPQRNETENRQSQEKTDDEINQGKNQERNRKQEDQQDGKQEPNPNSSQQEKQAKSNEEANTGNEEVDDKRRAENEKIKDGGSKSSGNTGSESSDLTGNSPKNSNSRGPVGNFFKSFLG